MKELSIEQKAKAYDEALERAKQLYVDGMPQIARNTIEHIFPELKESEDEKIKQRIIKLIKMSSEVGGFALHKWEADEMLAWLEKQGEHANFLSKIQVGDRVTRNEGGVLVNLSQLERVAKPRRDKPADKVEPKFKVGDWVFIEEIKGYKQGAFQIKSIDEFGYNFDEYHTIPFMYEELLSKWTVQDAKDGDVLALSYASKNYIIIYRGAYEKGFNTIISVFCFYSVEEDTYYDETDSFHVINTGEVIKPATKEQRDFLFQKMKEAGYEWNTEKKELKKIEQKSA